MKYGNSCLEVYTLLVLLGLLGWGLLFWEMFCFSFRRCVPIYSLPPSKWVKKKKKKNRIDYLVRSFVWI
jgi:hypothetical protein